MMFALLFSAVLESEKPLVCLDPGHPSEVSRGATGKEISELEAVWKIALLTRPMLEGKGVRVVMTKKSLEEMVSNRRRAEIANQAGADLAVRLHMDAAPVRGWMTVFPDRV
ncbi:MAG: N-acetylmuramoyl-L-alanine amidase, partial [Fimbriimonadaceae bacterium]|nr:N-acetylmuramoyl-L-alanine amidase [Fimbriimonadaceae bacterium]